MSRVRGHRATNHLINYGDFFTKFIKEYRKREYMQLKKVEKFLPRYNDFGDDYILMNSPITYVRFSIADRYCNEKFFDECKKCPKSCKQTFAKGLSKLYCGYLDKDLIKNEEKN